MTATIARARAAAARSCALGATALALIMAGGLAAQAQEVAPITIVINQSPWFDGFRNVVEAYEAETGNRVELDVNPFAGSLEKQRAAVRTGESPFDILIINAGFFIEMYQGGFLKPLQEIDPEFELDPAVYTFDDSVYWNPETQRVDPDDGRLLTVPINPNIPLLYYRSDLYAEKGLEVPSTWDELLANAKALHEPPARYGISQRGARGAFDVTYDVLPYIWSHGGDVFRDQKGGDFTITINSPESKAGLDTYLRLAAEAGHPRTAGQSQSDVIQNMVTGRAGHMVTVIAAWAQMDDPTKSIVVDQVDFAPPPHAPGFTTAPPLGHWLGGIPQNIPEARQEAALAFLKWFQTYDAQVTYSEGGGPPVRSDVLGSDLAAEPRFRWMKALAEALPYARLTFTIVEASEIVAITELRLNQAISGELGAAEALNAMAAEIEVVMRNAGYETERLPDLPG